MTTNPYRPPTTIEPTRLRRERRNWLKIALYALAIVFSQAWLWLPVAGVNGGAGLVGSAIGALAALALFVLAIPLPTYTPRRRRPRRVRR